MPCGITQCYLAAVTFPPLPQPKLVLDLVSREECKAELTWVTSQGSLPAKEQSSISEITRQCHDRESNPLPQVASPSS